MNSPPEALSPSPSTPSSGSPSQDDVALPTPTPTTSSSTTVASPSLAKRRHPASASTVFAGRENKSRRREPRDGGDMRPGAWDPVRTGEGHGTPSGGRMREELLDVHIVDYVRNMYGDPFDDTIFEKKNKGR